MNAARIIEILEGQEPSEVLEGATSSEVRRLVVALFKWAITAREEDELRLIMDASGQPKAQVISQLNARRWAGGSL